MNNKTVLFHQYKNMIYKTVWQYKKRYQNIEFEEIRGMAFEIFCIACDTYNSSKACFSTHLTHQLHRLNNKNWCPKENIKNKTIEYNSCIETKEFENFILTMELIENKTRLSNDAKDIMDYLLSRQWETIGENKKPSLHSITKIYRKNEWSIPRIKKAWDEIDNWWKEFKEVV